MLTYIDYLNIFNQWVESNTLPVNSQLLFFKLLNVFNRAGWPEHVRVDTLRLQMMIGASDKRAAYRARDSLVEAGIISYQKGSKGNPSLYRIILGCKNATENGTKNGTIYGTESGTKSGTENGTHIKTKNKTKTSTNTSETKVSSVLVNSDVSTEETNKSNLDSFTKPVILLPLNDGTEYPITREQFQEWIVLYPAVDVMQQLRNMRGWLLSNPEKAKTKRGIQAFVTRWLAKDQDNGGSRQKSQGWPGKDKRYQTPAERNFQTQREPTGPLEDWEIEWINQMKAREKERNARKEREKQEQSNREN